MRKLWFVLLLFVTSSSLRGEQHRMTPELLWKLGRLGDAAVSRDGSRVAYTVKRYDLADNTGSTSVFVSKLDDGEPLALVEDWSSVSDLQFAPSSFGERLYFVGKPDEAEETTSQVWALNPVDGGLFQVTHVEDGVANLKVAPQGTHVAFTRDVKMDQEVTELYEDLPKAEARIIDSLMYRHWNTWHDYKYSHLHVARLDDRGRAQEAVDLMPKRKADCPLPPFGGAEQYAWSPDSTEIAFTLKDVPKWAASTNSDVFLVNISDPSTVRNLTAGNEGYDNDPIYSPDGKYLAVHSMQRAGFEADRNRIVIYDLAHGTSTEATAGLDQTAHHATWLPDSSALMFRSERQGTEQVFRISVRGGDAQQVSHGRFNWKLFDVFPDGKQALVSATTMERPAELAIMQLSDGSTRMITKINEEIFNELELPQVEERWVTATDGQKIHCWVMYPPDFDPSRKWPLIVYCQGGPQGQVGQWFSYRWNFHLMAAQGYVVLAPNRRGLPGFGRAWNDQISGDWGGQAMQDLLSATDDMRREAYIDAERVAAVGASFGGYSVYWLMGNHEDRFCCMIAHCGVFNLESMYGGTEELFFVDWDLGGPYWKSNEVRQLYERFSPHRFADRWRTPLLVIHGEKDFRIPVTQGMEAFTAAQIQNVPSRFLYFPDEGHWVLSPQNGVLWHRVFFEWLDKYCQPPPQ